MQRVLLARYDDSSEEREMRHMMSTPTSIPQITSEEIVLDLADLMEAEAIEAAGKGKKDKKKDKKKGKKKKDKKKDKKKKKKK